jgi:hypothetical protein
MNELTVRCHPVREGPGAAASRRSPPGWQVVEACDFPITTRIRSYTNLKETFYYSISMIVL